VTVFVALQDIDELMGPTCMYPCTHAPAFHVEVGERGPLVLRARRGVKMDLRAGEAVVMDSRLWHYGGANTVRRRSLLVVSFAARGARPKGSTYSLLPHLEGRYSLQALSREKLLGVASIEGRDGDGDCQVADQHSLEGRQIALLPLAAVKQLIQLAATLPANDPLVSQCQTGLQAAIEAPVAQGSNESGSLPGDAASNSVIATVTNVACEVPIVVLRALCKFRVLGPHLRSSSRWGRLQALVEIQLRAPHGCDTD
jgi:hypothetical protein